MGQFLLQPKMDGPITEHLLHSFSKFLKNSLVEKKVRLCDPRSSPIMEMILDLTFLQLSENNAVSH